LSIKKYWLTAKHKILCTDCEKAVSITSGWLHKLRRAMVRTGREKLTGTVAVDEAYIGGEEIGTGRKERCRRKMFSCNCNRVYWQKNRQSSFQNYSRFLNRKPEAIYRRQY